MDAQRQAPPGWDGRKIDGLAEVTFTSLLSPLLDRKQTALAYQDEVNVFPPRPPVCGCPEHVPLVRGVTGLTELAGADDRDNFCTGGGAGGVSSLLTPAASAIHAYDVAKTLTYVRVARY